MSPKSNNVPWNKGKTVGQKKPLSLQEICKIRDYLAREDKRRDLALFSCAFDTMLRGSDLLKITVGDVQLQDGSIRNEFSLRQKKTNWGMLVALSPHSQKVIADWITYACLKPSNFLFTKKREISAHPISTDQYRKLIKSWTSAIGLDPSDYSSHSLRRTKAVMVYDKTKNIEAVRHLLGHQRLSSTSAYLNTDQRKALSLAAEFQL